MSNALPFHTPIVGIEKTKDYEEFMTQLDAFLKSRGTCYIKEPVLGGMKVDLMKLMIAVDRNGGYTKVTEEREWKKIASYFKFPSTCTNSAYILKRIYVQTLKDYVEYLGQSANFVHNHQDEMIKKEIIARITSSVSNFYNGAPSATPYVRNVINQMESEVEGSSTSSEDNLPMMAIKDADPRFLNKGRKSRIYLSLQSNLPNEIEWAIEELLKLSLRSDLINLDKLPFLMETIVDIGIKKLNNYAKEPLKIEFEGIEYETDSQYRSQILACGGSSKNYSMNEDKYFPIKFFTKKSVQYPSFVLIYRIIIIIRNLSFNRTNLKPLYCTKELIKTILNYPQITQQMEKELLEIIDLQAVYFKEYGTDEIFNLIINNTGSNDLYICLTSYQALTKIFINSYNISLAEKLPKSVLTRALDMLTMSKYERSVQIIIQFFIYYVNLHCKCQVEFPLHFVNNLIRNLILLCSDLQIKYLADDEADFPIFDKNTRWLISNYQISKDSISFDFLYNHYKLHLSHDLSETDFVALIRKIYPGALTQKEHLEIDEKDQLPKFVYLKRKKPLQTETITLCLSIMNILCYTRRYRESFQAYIGHISELAELYDGFNHLLWNLTQ